MRRADRHGDVVARFGVDDGVVRGVEAHGALGDEEGLVVHLVPVGGGAGGARWDGEFGAADAVVLRKG